ncbi:ABC transporter ATP-binding protein [Actibacterium sp. 188UL27-1]|uniref:ABC transporter ATP-binding protein n=1 Tax=Actibacterium sp. 188UL27-1 TaxID=2786961 RepID=UPI001957FC42|nr:ABC transporter ATP-binding protein [Actibacterium sp. 188UL27-1]MBM7066300.1 ABC transporter ATP-binding protein [Actibacterium sp. 188UL27-1]
MSICVSALSKAFSGQRAIDDVSFEVPKNAFFCVVGASGCGKSTLLRLIAGLEAPDTGQIALSGRAVFGAGQNVPPENRNVGVVFQSYALWPHLSVAKNVAFPYEARGYGATDARARVADHLERVALTEFADRRPEALSGGQRQRVALARCLAGDAQTILMDEPLANLDPHLRGAMEGELRAFHDKSGVTTLYITHDQREAMALADLMAVMDKGRFLQLGTPQEVYTRPATETVARFIGRGTLVNADLQNGLARINGHEFPVQGTGPGKIFIRPKFVSISENGIPAQISAVQYRGGYWEVEAQIQGLPDPVALDLDRPARIRDRINVQFSGGWVLPG